MKACRAGHLCTVQFLVLKNADINRRTTNNDHTPLSLACAGGHLAIVQFLLDRGANMFHKLKVTEKIFPTLPMYTKPGTSLDQTQTRKSKINNESYESP